MSLSDDIIFWQRHFARPRLISSISVSGGYYEKMRDDGTIERVHYSVEDLWKPFYEDMKRIREYKSPLLERLKK